ncbi:MAG: dTDP-4-dehydrorhamnose reductase [Desulfocapsa sp.]|nr:MAG: dTDP-4-dehydrorhamnose reductase [Desulfocapsa sp.]
MNIVITGAGGQLGQDCLNILGIVHRVQGYTSRQLDITNTQQVLKEISRVQPDTLINCAAYTAVDNCEKDQERCRAVNELGAANLAAASAAIGCRLIHVSTDYVFDGNKPVPEPYTEQDPVSPLSAYGRTKLAGEQAVARHLDKYLILRTAWLYGIGGNNFLKTMLRLATSDPKRTIRVVDDQHGSLTWSMTLARQIERLLSSDLSGVVHATAENSSTWFGGAQYFLETMGVDFSLEPCTTADYPTPAHRPTNSILENSRLKKHGLHVMQDWQQDIHDFVDRYREDLLEEASA